MRIAWNVVIRTAIKEAHKSYIRFRHGAVIIYRGRIIAKGYNKQKSRGEVLKHQKSAKGNISVHAEIDALFDLVRNGYNVNILRECFMVVIRLPGGENLDIDNIYRHDCLLSKPCSNCTKVLNKVGLGKVYYS
jgi:deoxycytidylate deaminase